MTTPSSYQLFNTVVLVRRGEIIKSAIRNSKGLYTPAFFVEIVSDLKSSQSGAMEPLFENDQSVQELQKSIKEKIVSSAQNGDLGKSPLLRQILDYWCRYGGKEECQNWVKKFISTPDKFLLFLNAFCTPKQSVSEVKINRYQYCELNKMEEFVTTSLLDEQLSSTTEDQLDEAQRKNIEALRQALADRNRSLGAPRSNQDSLL